MKSLANGLWRSSRLAFDVSSEGMEGNGTSVVSLSRVRTAGNSEDCLPLTGVTGSLRDPTVSESSSLSSGIEVVSSVGNCGGEDEDETLELSGRGGSKLDQRS